MTDRELLKMAAKAAGFGISFRPSGMCVVQGDYSIGPAWNPLDDSGDALNLSIGLGLSIRFGDCSDSAPVVWCGEDGQMTNNFPDPYVATRRAIVRAAAEIGKAMP